VSLFGDGPGDGECSERFCVTVDCGIPDGEVSYSHLMMARHEAKSIFRQVAGRSS
jgi:hypothetical protein